MLSALAWADSDTGVIDLIEIEVTDSHQALQISFGEGEGNLFCNDPNANYPDNAYLSTTSPNYEAVLSMALAAYMSGSNIRIHTNYDPAQGGRCIISKMRLL